ncbi:hypothetical protein [Marinobacter sp. PE14]
MNRNARNVITVPLVFAAATLLGTSAVRASEPLSAEEISQAVSDHSYQGSMSTANSAFNEYYAPDGAIHGVDYKGEWTTQKGEMCFAYGQEPTCYAVSIDGPSMVLRQDGVIKGNGMLIQGNTVK